MSGAVHRALLLSSVRRRRGEFVRLMGWSLIEAVPAFLSGHLVARAVDRGFLAGHLATGLGWLALMAAGVLCGAWGTRQSYLRLAGVVEPFRDELVGLAAGAALRRSTRFAQPPDTAAVARLTRQVEVVREAYATVIMITLGFVITATSTLLGLLTLAPAVLVLVLPPLLIGMWLFLSALRAMAARQRAALLADERIAESVSALAGGFRDVVACGAQERARAAIGAHIDAQARAAYELARLTAIRTAALGIGGRLPVVLVLLAAPWLARHGATTGTVLGALTYLLQGLQPALQTLIRGVGGSGLWLMVTLGRIAEAADLSGSDRAPTPAIERIPSRGHDLELRGVRFGYGCSAEPVICDLDLLVPEDDHIAIVGPSGAGKSTLAGLVTGMLEPQSGYVRLGAIPAHEVDSRCRVLIPQEAYVFAGTLLENIVYLRPGAGRAEVDAALEIMGLRPIIERLGGYRRPIEPQALSAGERQLVALARAYLARAPLTVLDEATCHLDPTAEARAERAFADRPGTLLVIAHRITSAQRARRILVLDGTRALLGTHESLLVDSPLYQDLVGHWK